MVQRLVDGLLVAQREPGDARGLYDQRNAESTRVFGNPQARPQDADLDDPQRADLTYYVLVNGQIEVPMLMTISDVGEQVAWNGFLALRDSERAFQISVKEWERVVKTGRLWTPDPQFNRAIQAGRLDALRTTQRLRTGLAPSDRTIVHMADLVDCIGTVEPVQSQNLLAHLRRVAEKGNGAVPATLPLRRKDPLPLPGDQLLASDLIYLRALNNHLAHHGDNGLLAEHMSAIKLCADAIVLDRVRQDASIQQEWLHEAITALDIAVALAKRAGDDVDVARWESEATAYRRQASQLVEIEAVHAHEITEWQSPVSWQVDSSGLWAFEDSWDGIRFAADAIWNGCGLRWRDGKLAVSPTFSEAWNWWALMDLPWGEDSHITLVWDGECLHTTQPVQSELPVVVHDTIKALHTDEYDFDLRFEFVDTVGSVPQRSTYHPEFLTH